MIKKYMELKPTIVSFILLILFNACSNSPNETSESKKPNVIIIYTDDQGSIDVNCYGAKDLYTPSMDKLAKQGIRFTQFYTAASVCSPSRASLLTGKTPLAAGLPGNTSSFKGHAGMPTEQTTIAEVLKENGYKTGHVGKWHLGYSEPTMPNGQGFDYSFGHMGGCIDNYSHFFYWNGPNRHDLWEDGKETWLDGQYFQDIMAKKVNEFLDANKKDPFFLYYAINLPHYPLQGTKKWREHYKDLESPRNKYAACVSTVDEKIGILLSKLDELDLRKNTIIIFQSDHGHSVETRTFGGGGNSGPYRGSKFSNFEGGIRVPAIISWTTKVPEDEVRNQMAVNVDWFPTILDLCEIPYDNDQLEGKSIKDIIYNSEAESPHTSFTWYKSKTHWAVRKGDWKLLINPVDHTLPPGHAKLDSVYLVNIIDDPGEKTNMAKENPEKVNELTTAYYRWYDNIN